MLCERVGPLGDGGEGARVERVVEDVLVVQEVVLGDDAVHLAYVPLLFGLRVSRCLGTHLVAVGGNADGVEEKDDNRLVVVEARVVHGRQIETVALQHVRLVLENELHRLG